MPDQLLRVEHLTTVFETPRGEVRAVDDVSFEVRRGETVALVGESGSGKSVTALSVMRLIEPPGYIRSGTISFEGRNLLELAEREMRKVRGARVSLVFQEPVAALNPVFTVGDQVAETLVVHGQASAKEARTRAVQLLEEVRIADPARVARAYPHQLSGGMRQRALIASAIACRPALVIADEPTTALDVTIQAEILDLLSALKAAYQLSLLLITHDLGIVAHMADRVAVMQAGRIVEQADVRTLFKAPTHAYTRELLRAAGGTSDGADRSDGANRSDRAVRLDRADTADRVDTAGTPDGARVIDEAPHQPQAPDQPHQAHQPRVSHQPRQPNQPHQSYPPEEQR